MSLSASVRRCSLSWASRRRRRNQAVCEERCLYPLLRGHEPSLPGAAVCCKLPSPRPMPGVVASKSPPFEPSRPSPLGCVDVVQTCRIEIVRYPSPPAVVPLMSVFVLLRHHSLNENFVPHRHPYGLVPCRVKTFYLSAMLRTVGNSAERHGTV